MHPAEIMRLSVRIASLANIQSCLVNGRDDLESVEKVLNALNIKFFVEDVVPDYAWFIFIKERW